MMSLGFIESESRKATAKAARTKSRPIPLYAEDVANKASFRAFCKGIPNLGSYKHPGDWVEVAVNELLPGYPYKWLFVDSSGFGGEGEAALTVEGLRLKLKGLCDKDGYRYGLGIAEVGQFQIHIALYKQRRKE